MHAPDFSAATSSIILLAAVAAPDKADLPLTTEDLLTDKGKVKLDISMTYANTEHSGVPAGEPIAIRTAPTSFLTLPFAIGERTLNSDSLVGTIGLRYGLTGNAEIYARSSYLHHDQRSSDVSGINSHSANHWADAWAGINYQFKKDGDTPALLGSMESALSEKHRESRATFKSTTLMGLTTYKAIDPVCSP